MILNFKELQIGLTNRCRLLCYECPRTAIEGRYFTSLFDLDIEYFKSFLSKCNPEIIFFCGTWGDPIYARDFVGLCRSLKNQYPNIKLMINTNGTGKTAEWWEELMQVLTDQDIIMFSIDGTPDNFNTYRVNAKWEDLETAVTTCVKHKQKNNKKTELHWKYLVFSYNQDTIMSAYELSKSMGFDQFFLQKSLVRTGEGTEWLKPTRPHDEIEKEFNARKSNTLL